MTLFFLKLTSQMVKNCYQYIMKDNKNLNYIWNYSPIEDLVAMFYECIELNKEYKGAYNVTKEKLNQ